MAELQVALVFTVGFPPGVFGVVWPLQRSLVELVLQLALLEFGTIRPGVLRGGEKKAIKVNKEKEYFAELQQHRS